MLEKDWAWCSHLDLVLVFIKWGKVFETSGKRMKSLREPKIYYCFYCVGAGEEREGRNPILRSQSGPGQFPLRSEVQACYTSGLISTSEFTSRWLPWSHPKPSVTVLAFKDRPSQGLWWLTSCLPRGQGNSCFHGRGHSNQRGVGGLQPGKNDPGCCGLCDVCLPFITLCLWKNSHEKPGNCFVGTTSTEPRGL